MMLRSALLYLLLIFSFNGIAQTFSISGRVIDEKDKSTLINVTVVLSKTSDTSVKTGTITDVDGNFQIDGVSPGGYLLHIEYVGYKAINKLISVADKNVAAGTLSMQSKANELNGVTVEGKQVRGEQLGDTTQFHADAFKTHPDATAEDLVTKMPGVTSDNTGVKVNGEAVQQVYVDGKPFFGTDPTLALKNMPSEIIDKIQIFDKLSDQSTFTGFDDGNSQKTMNIITRKGKSEGTFGKIYAGYGTDDRYIAAGNLNIFNGDQRISILGMSNNINQQNFSSQDLLGITSGSGSNRGGGSGGRGNFGGGQGGGGGANNFLVGQQGGITNTNSAGINYSDNWGKKIKVSGSYFFNNTKNTTSTDLTRNYFTSNDTTNVYHEYDNSTSNNYNHRFNLRFEYTIDSFNSIIFTPGISFQKNNSNSSTSARDSAITQLSSNILSTTANSSTANNNGYSSSNNLLIQHKFKKQRRTISLNISASLNDKTSDGTYKSLNEYYETIGAAPRNQNYDQSYTLKTNGNTVSPNVTYTEPIGKKGQLMFNYNPSYSYSYSDKSTFDIDPATQALTLNDTFSNKYNTTYLTQKGGLSYRIGDKKMNFSVGANVQYATLSGERTYPNTFNINESFSDVLPNAMFNYRFSDGRNLRINYRTNTVAPSVTQLQDLVDISNPLLLKTGNPDLRQDYEHTLFIRYGLTQKKSAKMFFLNVYANYINNYIGNATYTTSSYRDTITHETVTVPKGSQLTVPMNMNGYLNTRTFITYGIPVKFIKCNLNLSGGFNYTRTPGKVDDKTDFSNNYIPSGGIVLSSNISENLDFTLSYYGSYNIVSNTLQSQASNNYYNHVASFKINYIFLKHFVLNTNITENYYTAFSSTGNQDFYLWNAYLGYKFLKNNALEARISAYDILNQNKSISRTVTETYIENNTTQVLRQYFLFQLTYTIRNFKGTMPTEDKHEDRPWQDHRHG